jgi:hypothetical protein
VELPRQGFDQAGLWESVLGVRLVRIPRNPLDGPASRETNSGVGDEPARGAEPVARSVTAKRLAPNHMFSPLGAVLHGGYLRGTVGAELFVSAPG